MLRPASLLVCLGIVLGCATVPEPVAPRGDLLRITGHTVPAHPGAISFEVPQGVFLADGVTEEEAVALGLWNAPGLHAELTALGVARAELLQAGLLRNPILSVLLPSGPKQAEATLSWLLDSLWERPRRVAAARLQRDQIAELLVSRGLDGARDIRLAFNRALETGFVARLSVRELELRVEADSITQARAQAGQTNELEAMLARSETLVARARAARAGRDAEQSLLALRTAIGAGTEAPRFEIVPDGFVSPAPPDRTRGIRMAREARPELRAAGLAMEEATRQAGWERRRLLKLTAVLDANDQEGAGYELGPGLIVELPLFDRNQAGIRRAEARIQDTAWRYLAVKRRIDNEVEEADAAYRFALGEREHFLEQTQPALERARAVAREVERKGALSHLEVLSVEHQQLISHQQGVQLETEVRRTLAELERSLGRILDERS